MTAIAVDRWLCAGSVSEVQKDGSKVVHLDGNTIALFAHEGQIYAVDNRCPHLGFPLHKGTVKDCVLTCHWHQARFDLKSGGTFDQWADDVRSFPTEVRGDEVWVDLTPHKDAIAQQSERLEVGHDLAVRRRHLELTAHREPRHPCQRHQQAAIVGGAAFGDASGATDAE